MMQRIPEPELMESAPQVSAYASADFSETDASVLTRLAALVRQFGLEPSEDDVLVDLGCGPGNISERLHRRWPMCQELLFPRVGKGNAQKMFLPLKLTVVKNPTFLSVILIRTHTWYILKSYS